MAKTLLISRSRRILIVVIHLLPLPGSPRWGENVEKVIRSALDDARACEDGGADAILIENYGDAPFNKGPVPAETVAAMAVVGVAVRDAVQLPLGFNVLRNDGHAAARQIVTELRHQYVMSFESSAPAASRPAS